MIAIIALGLSAAADGPVLARAPLIRGNPSKWFAGIYPKEAALAREQGTTVVFLEIDATGTITKCTVQKSSGSAALDEATCQVALTRARYKPGEDTEGCPLASTAVLPVTWALP
ncbi:energy transducer TonB [Sphingomonas endolithica]|uniref:energy transducer TonB n=1 Tax=Sphingomonas endolithica TaxID=2972485 RepID=UPI003AAACA81